MQSHEYMIVYAVMKHMTLCTVTTFNAVT